MIPAKIHYCWFGKSSLPATVLQCIDSWKKFMPEYSIHRWDEHKISLDCKFVRSAYKAKKWAFVSDYIRLVALYKEGGIYLDTDMLLVRSLEELRLYPCFFGFESRQMVNGAIIGAEAGNSFIYSLIKEYQGMLFQVSNPLTIPQVITHKLQRKDFNMNNQLQCIDEITVFPQDYFYPLPQVAKDEPFESYLTENSFTVHLWDYSWMNEFSYFWKGEYKKGFKESWRILRKDPIQPVSYYKDILFHIKRFLASWSD